MNALRRGPGKHPLRRASDVVCGAFGLLFLSPLLAALALLILLRDGRPVLFSQMRVGQYGIQFRIWKFRTMRAGDTGRAITTAGDGRVTETGAWLRKFKLDELPQLLNVLRGDMSLVGPRPEVPEYVNARSPMWQAVLQVRPGITDLATLVYRNEEELLEAFSDADRFYREAVLPAKLGLNLAYIRTRSFWQDMRLIWLTVRYSLSPERFTPARIRRAFIAGTDYGGHLHSVSPTIDR
jgi:lipopolysaccharide/colanic/teichoic acid biosynthesis glycosyltransferase